MAIRRIDAPTGICVGDRNVLALRKRRQHRERAFDRIERAKHFDAHLHRQRPARGVVGRHGLAVLEVVGVVLRLEEIAHVRTECLRREHDERTRGRLSIADDDGHVRNVDFDARSLQRLRHAERSSAVALVERHHPRARVAQHRIGEHCVAIFLRLGLLLRERHESRRRRPVIARTALDRIAAHAPDVAQQLAAVARRVVEDREVGGLQILDRLARVPDLRRHGIRVVTRRKATIDRLHDARGVGMAECFGEQPDDVVEVARRSKAAVPPSRVGSAAARDHAGLAFACEATIHRRCDPVDASHDRWVRAVVERIAERRSEEDRALRRGLVVVVDDLRTPVGEEHTAHCARLFHVARIEVAVVVVAEEPLVEDRDVDGSSRRVGVRDQLEPVWVHGAREQHDLVEDATDLGIVSRRHLPHEFDDVLPGDRLGRMQARVDPHDCAPVLNHRLGFRLFDARAAQRRRDRA